jgi:uncharacterized protein YbjT (DUF2867 family)
MGFTGSPQGPLGEAHKACEDYMRSLNLQLVSIRPTSFFTNFLKWDLPSIHAASCFSSPLGTTARVNWVHPSDIGDVAAAALCLPDWDGLVLEVTGPHTNTLTALEMQQILSAIAERSISYIESPLPPSPDYEGLWHFLRTGGFDHSSDDVVRVSGKAPERFDVWLAKQPLKHVSRKC